MLSYQQFIDSVQLAAEKKDSKNDAARNFFGPSYFVTTVGIVFKISIYYILENPEKYNSANQIISIEITSHKKVLTDDIQS